MAQHDQVLENNTGLGFRTDTNALSAAIFSSSSGPVEPAVKVPGQWWFDTSNPAVTAINVRSQDNASWIPMQLSNAQLAALFALAPVIPSAGGPANVLTTDSTGALVWSNTVRRFNIQRFLTAGTFTYTRTPGCSLGDIVSIGGNGGCLGWTGASGWVFGAGSGGLGSICKGRMQTLPATASVVVGHGAVANGTLAPGAATGSSFNGSYGTNGGGTSNTGSSNGTTLGVGNGGAGGAIGATTGAGIENFPGQGGDAAFVTLAFFMFPGAKRQSFEDFIANGTTGNVGSGVTNVAGLGGLPGAVYVREYYDA